MSGALTAVGDVILVAAGMVFCLLSTPFVAAHLMRRLEVAEVLTDLDVLEGVDAIVVLSADIVHHAPEYGEESVGPLTLERLRYAAHLRRATGLPLLVTGGRISPWDPPLGEIMARVLADDFGMKVTWIESESRTTLDHASFCVPVLRADGVRRICLVTHAHHVRRAKLAFEDAGLEVVPAPIRSTARPRGLWRDFVPGTAALNASAVAIREGAAGFVYRVRRRGSESRT